MMRRARAPLDSFLRRPSALPGGLVLMLTLLILTQAAVLLINQPAAYWLDPHIHMPSTPFGFLLERGPWIYAAAVLAYTLLAAMFMTHLKSAAAWALAGWLFIFHLAGLTWISYCGWTSIVRFAYQPACSGFQLTLGLIGALCVGLSMTLAFHPRPPLRSSEDHAPLIRLRRGYVLQPIWLWLLIPAWLLALLVGVVHAASFTGSAWQPLAPAHSPGLRMQAAVAYDTHRMRAVMFGGVSGWTGNDWIYADDTWEWDGKDWTLIPTPVHPSARSMHSMAYDEARGVVVLFGGHNGDGPLADTWEWDGKTWSQPCGCGPAARYGQQLVYDPVQQKSIVYGGYDDEDYITASCAWDGKSWGGQIFENLMPDFYAAPIVYDPSAGRMLAFLGGSAGGAWSVTDRTWTRLPDPLGPAPRDHSVMIYDPDQAQIILFGGRSGPMWLNDTWILKSGAWQRVDSGQAPAARGDALAFYDLKRHAMIVYGGEHLDGPGADMWELALP